MATSKPETGGEAVYLGVACRIASLMIALGVWVYAARAATPYGVYRAVSIPIQDFETPNVTIVLGLKLDATETNGQKADMIVVNVMPNRQVYYDDYVKPVPPFSPSLTATDFYLLQL